MTEIRCKDCRAEGITTVRPLVPDAPGPRCATHWRLEKVRRRRQAHDNRIRNGYEMTPAQYQALLEYQGGKCFICQKATGKARALAVDHEHGMAGCEHPPEQGCPRCWRALLCKRCNRLVAFLDVDALARAIVLLTNPPARQLFTLDQLTLDQAARWIAVDTGRSIVSVKERLQQ